MPSARPDVLLLRSRRSPDRYETAFATAGYTAACFPVLSFRFPHQDVLRQRLAAPDDHAALIATSARAVEAVRRVFEANPSVHERWQGRRAFAVGPATAQRWRTLGLRPEGESAGDAAALAVHIASVVQPTGPPLLFLSGNRRRDTLPDGLAARTIPYEEQEVYVTVPRDDLVLPTADEATWLVFFGPSGLAALRQSNASVAPCRVAAIGRTTAAALREAGISVEAVAGTPSPEGLVASIQRARPRTT